MPGSPTASAASAAVRFRDDQAGATAVELGFLLGPFMLLLVAIVEIALTFWSTQVLETAVANASRMIYTGQFQQDSANANLTADQLRAKMKENICKHVTTVFKCDSMVSVDVQTFDKNSDAAALGSPVDANKKYDTSSYGYKKPEANQITVVRASMEYPVLVPMVLSKSGKLANGNRLIVAAATFRTEPYAN